MNDTESVEHESDGEETQTTADQTSRAGAMAGSLVTKPTVKRAIQRLKDALDAKKVIYGKSKDQFQEQDDWPTIVKAAELLLAYGEGRPVERQLIIKGNAENFDERIAKLVASPAGRALAVQMGLISETEILRPAKAKKGAE